MNLAFNFCGHGMTRFYIDMLRSLLFIITAAVDHDEIYMIQLYDIDSENGFGPSLV